MKIIKNHIGNAAAVGLLLGVVTLTAGCSTQAATSNSLSFGQTSVALTSGGTGREQTISTIDPSWYVSRMDANGAAFYVLDAISPDGKHIAYRANTGNDKCFVVLDNHHGKSYDKTFDYVFSPDSKRMAYIAQDGDYGVVVVNGIEGKRYPLVPGAGIERMTCPISSLVFSPDSRSLVYIVQIGEKSLVVKDGVEGNPYDRITGDSGNLTPGIVFSQDSHQMAFAAETGNQEFAVINGIEGKPYDHIGMIVFSPDGKHVAYTADKHNRWFTVIDGIENETDTAFFSNFSPDSRHTVSIAGTPGDQWVIQDGKAGPHYTQVSDAVFSPDSKRLAYAAATGDSLFVVINGVEGKHYTRSPSDNISGIIFSPDSERIAFIVSQTNKNMMVVDGTEGKQYDSITSPVFSPNSRRFAYIAQNNFLECFMVIDNVESKPYDFLFLSPVFSPDSKGIVYSAQKAGKEILVCNSVEEKPYDWIFFEPYSRKINGVNSTIFFDSPNSLHYLAKSGNSIILVEKNIK